MLDPYADDQPHQCVLPIKVSIMVQDTINAAHNIDLARWPSIYEEDGSLVWWELCLQVEANDVPIIRSFIVT